MPARCSKKTNAVWLKEKSINYMFSDICNGTNGKRPIWIPDLFHRSVYIKDKKENAI